MRIFSKLRPFLKRSAAISLSAAIATCSAAEPEKPPTFERPAAFDFLKKAPGDIEDYGTETFQRKNIPVISAVVGSTLLLIVADQYLVDRAHNLGDHLGISHTPRQKKFARIFLPGSGTIALNIEGPYDSGSALYFLGDGWVDVGLVSGFLTVGLVQKDNRALQTASQITEALLAGGTVVQVLKHVTGRESPFSSSTPGGTWRFFPNQYAYAKNVPHYDAFPSGHLCAAMSTVTIIAENYPEYTFVRPLGYSLMGILGLQMMNNGVHWASDYPLGLALGYGFGKIAVRKGRRSSDQASIRLYPMLLPGGGGVSAIRKFGGVSPTKEI